MQRVAPLGLACRHSPGVGAGRGCDAVLLEASGRCNAGQQEGRCRPTRFGHQRRRRPVPCSTQPRMLLPLTRAVCVQQQRSALWVPVLAGQLHRRLPILIGHIKRGRRACGGGRVAAAPHVLHQQPYARGVACRVVQLHGSGQLGCSLSSRRSWPPDATDKPRLTAGSLHRTAQAGPGTHQPLPQSAAAAAGCSPGSRGWHLPPAAAQPRQLHAGRC